MPFPLRVPFPQKDEVKQLGAFWSPEKKSWMIPDHMHNVTAFKKWIPFKSGFIIRKPYQILTTARNCWKCKKVTPMMALAGTNYYEYEYTDENDQNSKKEWLKADYPVIFCNVTKMDDYLAEYLQTHFPFYRPTYSFTQERQTWANNCQMCGKLQGETPNHEDFGGAFFPDPYEPNLFQFHFHNMSIDVDYHFCGELGSLDLLDLPSSLY